MSITNRSFKVPAGYTDQAANKSVYDKVYVGFIKDNQDVQKMGRLRVWIPEMGGDPNDDTKWITVRYVSPFAGATSPHDTLVKGSRKMDDAQHSYGWWAIPPDLENEVVIVFVNGDPGRGLVIGYLYQQFMNHMVPGLASAQTFPEQASGADVNPPTTEYNKWAAEENIKPPDPLRPRFDPLHYGLYNQGLYSDQQRGPTTASARRGAVAEVYGFKSPRGHHWYIDDQENNEYFRIRTKGGTQILVHDTSGYVYINSKNGNSWLEVSDTGIDLYTNRSFSVRAKQDINIRGDQNVNIEAGGDVNIRSAGGQLKFEASSGAANIRAKGAINLETASSFNQKIAGTLVISAGGNVSIGSGGTMVQSAAQIRQNSGGAGSANAAEGPESRDLPDAVLKAPHYPSTKTLNTILTRMPHHEPWKRETAPPPLTIEHKGAGESPAEQRAAAKKYQQEEYQRRNDPAADQDHEDKIQKQEYKPASPLDVKASVEQAIIQAAAKTGIDVGYMFAMAQQESSFDPNARATTSSAKGLYQFIDGTWSGMVKKYGSTYGITDSNEDKFNAAKNAMMAALYSRDNEKDLQSVLNGRRATPTELYLAHFLGSGGAKQFLRAEPNTIAAQILPSPAKANPSIFYADRGKGPARTVQEVYSFFEKKISPPAKAYSQKYSDKNTGLV